MTVKIHTEFGIAGIYNGYYRIVSSSEGNYGKYLHRLIYEKHCGKIPESYFVHHIDENKLNNDISNLQLVTLAEHNIIHKTGEKNHNYGKKLSKEHRMKISKSNMGKTFSKESRMKLSEAHTGHNNYSAKYTLWDIVHVHFNKSYFKENNPLRKSFKCKFRGKQLPIGSFNEFVSCDVINALILEAIQ